jgi:hypothetical protein
MNDPLTQPEFQMASGLLRTIRWELEPDQFISGRRGNRYCGEQCERNFPGLQTSIPLRA